MSPPLLRPLLALSLLAMLAVPALAARTRDSSRVTHRVRVDASGVEVEERVADELDTLQFRESGSGDGGARIRFRGRGGSIEIDETDAVVRMFSDIAIDEGERIDGDVVAVFGSVTVRGEVTGNVVAVMGSVILEPGAGVDGDAVAVGGVLEQEPGARVSGESVSVGFFPLQLGVPTLGMLLSMVFCGWLLSVFVGWLFTLIAPERTVRVGATVSRRTGLSLLLGILSMPAFAVAVLLLFITVVGIPVGILLPILYLVMLAFGHAAATAVLGSRLLRRPLGEGSSLAAIAAGSAFVAMFFVAAAVLSGPAGLMRTLALFFVALGVLLSIGLSTIGIGAVMASKFGAEPRDLRLAPGGATAIPPPSPPLPSPSPGA